jgi:CTP:molybdopterin cytidylyltransferase MocA
MTVGLVLAAGAGSRLGRPKAELVVGGSRLIDRAVEVLRAGGCGEVVAVVRSSAVTADGARSVVNAAADTGMAGSLRIGLAAAAPDECVVVLVDQMGITPADVAAVIAARRSTGAEVVVARRNGHRSHPVLVTPAAFADFGGSAQGDAGARGFIDAHPDRLCFVDLDDVVTDIDTPAELARFEGGT